MSFQRELVTLQAKEAEWFLNGFCLPNNVSGLLCIKRSFHITRNVSKHSTEYRLFIGLKTATEGISVRSEEEHFLALKK